MKTVIFFLYRIMTNYDFDETALSETIDFTAFLKMNCIRIPPSARSSHSAKQNLGWLRRLVIRRDPRSGRIPYDLPLIKKGCQIAQCH